MLRARDSVSVRNAHYLPTRIPFPQGFPLHSDGGHAAVLYLLDSGQGQLAQAVQELLDETAVGDA